MASQVTDILPHLNAAKEENFGLWIHGKEKQYIETSDRNSLFWREVPDGAYQIHGNRGQLCILHLSPVRTRLLFPSAPIKRPPVTTRVPSANLAVTALPSVENYSSFFPYCMSRPEVRTVRSFCRPARRNLFVGYTWYRGSQVAVLRTRRPSSPSLTLESTFVCGRRAVSCGPIVRSRELRLHATSIPNLDSFLMMPRAIQIFGTVCPLHDSLA